MKPTSFLILLLAFAPGAVEQKLPAATLPPDAAGHWEGAITLPATQLGILVDLDRDPAGAWSGTIDIPAQGLRGFKLGDVVANGAAISFSMPNIPGSPKFNGKLAAERETISGEFSQGGQTFPFKLERKPRPAAITGETPGKGVPGKGLAGHWQGSLKPSPVIELRLTLEITNSPANELTGVMVSVDQGNVRIPLMALTEKDGAVHLETKSVGGSFDGKFSADGSEIAGDWKQGGGTLPLVFKRLAKTPDFSRPQEPKKPYPYAEEEALVDNPAAGVKLAGTLTLPRGPGPHPAVVLITGSGPQDRDEAIMGHRPFLVLADYLTRRGIAVLRCDDRGIGKSTGDFSKATDTDFVEDALAAVAWLKERKDIDPKRIGLVGHSEGGIIAPLAAVKSGDVAFIVLMAGVGVPVEELLARQGQDLMRVMGADAETMTRSATAQHETFRLLKEGKDLPTLEKQLRDLFRQQMAELSAEQRQSMGYSDAMLESQLQAVLTPWFRQLLVYDPRPALKKVRCPVLAVNGEKDIQVAAKENLAAIRQALDAGGNKKVKIMEFPGLNHLFQHCTTGAVGEYGQIEETIAPEVLQLIADWIREQTAA